jgi:hypothetical protein
MSDVNEAKCRADLRENLIRLEQWTQRLKKRIEDDPEDVVPFFPIEVLQKEMTGILYHAGAVNGFVLARLNQPTL